MSARTKRVEANAYQQAQLIAEFVQGVRQELPMMAANEVPIVSSGLRTFIQVAAEICAQSALPCKRESPSEV